MSQSLSEVTIARILMTHQMLIQLTEALSEAQFGWQPGPQAPPIGWHLWHMARWADRVQASFPTVSGDTECEIWEAEQLLQRWELDGATLGALQTGTSMNHQTATRLVHDVGQLRLLDYARRSFAALDAIVTRLQPDEFDTTRTSVRAFRINEQRRAVAAPAPETTMASDLMFHLHHASRHLGIIEGLIGAQGLDGTASA